MGYYWGLMGWLFLIVGMGKKFTQKRIPGQGVF
jgi:hypothetical protein